MTEKVKYRWTTTPKTDDKVLKAIRNFISDEFNGHIIYPELDSFRDWSPDSVFNWVLEKGTRDQYEALIGIYENNLEKENFLPGANALHKFNIQFDKAWNVKNVERNWCALDINYRKGKISSSCMVFCKEYPDDELCSIANQEGVLKRV